jgi:hypothetical protein
MPHNTTDSLPPNTPQPIHIHMTCTASYLQRKTDGIKAIMETQGEGTPFLLQHMPPMRPGNLADDRRMHAHRTRHERAAPAKQVVAALDLCDDDGAGLAGHGGRADAALVPKLFPAKLLGAEAGQ